MSRFQEGQTVRLPDGQIGEIRSHLVYETAGQAQKIQALVAINEGGVYRERVVAEDDLLEHLGP